MLECDKSRKFGVLPQGLSLIKGNEDISKLSKPFTSNLNSVKASISKLLLDVDSALQNKVKGCKSSTPSLKFLLKEHKVDLDLPFRTVVSELGETFVTSQQFSFKTEHVRCYQDTVVRLLKEYKIVTRANCVSSPLIQKLLGT